MNLITVLNVLEIVFQSAFIYENRKKMQKNDAN